MSNSTHQMMDVICTRCPSINSITTGVGRGVTRLCHVPLAMMAPYLRFRSESADSWGWSSCANLQSSRSREKFPSRFHQSAYTGLDTRGLFHVLSLHACMTLLNARAVWLPKYFGVRCPNSLSKVLSDGRVDAK